MSCFHPHWHHISFVERLRRERERRERFERERREHFFLLRELKRCR